MRLGRVAVVGDSMSPTLAPGDWWLVRWFSSQASRPPIRSGQVVVARRPDRPGLLVVKRVTDARPGKVWLTGDNPAASDDSRLFGWVPESDVLGVLWIRYRRGRRTTSD